MARKKSRKQHIDVRGCVDIKVEHAHCHT